MKDYRPMKSCLNDDEHDFNGGDCVWPHCKCPRYDAIPTATSAADDQAMTSCPAAPKSETPETDKEEAELEMARGVMEEHGVNELPILKKKIVRSTFARSLERRLSLAQTEIKGHMRIEDDLKRDLGLERESHEVTKRMLSDRDDRIAELEKAALRVVEASDRDTKKGLSQQVAVENFSDSRPEEIEYIEAHLALLEAIGQLDEALKSRA